MQCTCIFSVLYINIKDVKKKEKVIFFREKWRQFFYRPVVLEGAAKLKVDPGAAAVVVVVPKPPNAPEKTKQIMTNGIKDVTQKQVRE